MRIWEKGYQYRILPRGYPTLVGVAIGRNTADGAASISPSCRTTPTTVKAEPFVWIS